MKKNSLNKTGELRQKAETLLNKKKGEGSETPFSESDILKFFYEIEVYQIELELQNEELTRAKDKAELAERKYTELYDFSPSSYLTLSKTGEITNLNTSAEMLLGKERSRLIGSSFGFFVSPDTRACYNSFLQKIFKTHLQQTCELTLGTNGKKAIYVLANGIVSNTNEKCLLTLTNITKNKHTEKKLIKAKINAEEGDRLKSAFLANMSHEIRTPMNGILGFSELLQNLSLTTEKQQEFIQIIQKSGVRMLNIINDIISISRIESQQVEIEITNTNINEQIEFIYKFFKPEAERKQLDIQFTNGLSASNAFILTDREKLYAVLTNLVKNAIKFTNTGAIEFGYDVKGEFLEFYVTDTGSGISKEQKEMIFERFRQVDESLTRNEGSGLGLAISKAYIEMLGGKIWVESKLWYGSIFRFTLPNLSVI